MNAEIRHLPEDASSPALCDGDLARLRGARWESVLARALWARIDAARTAQALLRGARADPAGTRIPAPRSTTGTS